MKPGASLLLVVASLALSATAHAEDPGNDPRPSPAIDYLAAGGALTAIGVLSFASSPICKTGVVGVSDQGACFTTSFLVGTPFLALGVPLIVYGALERAKYNEWAKRHPYVSGLTVSPAAGGGAVAWSARF